MISLLTPTQFQSLGIQVLSDQPEKQLIDLMRYAETYAHEFDYPIRHAFQYRDYVIRAFNADVPYDQLVTEHIAGDLLAGRRNRILEVQKEDGRTHPGPCCEEQELPVIPREDVLDLAGLVFPGQAGSSLFPRG